MDCLYFFRVSCIICLLTATTSFPSITVGAKRHGYMMAQELPKSSTEITDENDNRHKHQQHHFVLVHGLCLGAWSWYKAATVLRRAGHRVTALDMAASGVNPARVAEVCTLEEQSRPLLVALATLPPGKRVVLVGHSQGGFNVALAMERFPDKLAAVVFLTAFFPALDRPMAATIDEHLSFVGPDFFLDTKKLDQENPNIPGRPIIFGPNFVAQRLSQLSPPEDLTLALSLIRPANRFTNDTMMRDARLLTKGRYGSARRIFVVVEDDRAMPVEFQRRMVAQSPGVEVEEIAGADHTAMISRPGKVAKVLVRIANKHSNHRARVC